jgi:hypothetical protein
MCSHLSSNARPGFCSPPDSGLLSRRFIQDLPRSPARRGRTPVPLIVSKLLALLLLDVERVDKATSSSPRQEWDGCRSIVSNRLTDMRACNELLSFRLEHKRIL